MNRLLKAVYLVAEIKDIKMGTAQVDKLYQGTTLIFEKEPADTTAPTTTARPAGGTFTEPVTVWLDVDEAGNTYYTTDGSEPTTNSTLYADGIYLDTSTTLKFFTVDLAGNAETPKTETYTVSVATGWRYVRYQGFGDNTSTTTTRLVELVARDATGNLLVGTTPISGETPDTGATIEAATDGYTGMDSGSYPIWWTASGVPTLTYDLGEAKSLTDMQVWMYSTSADPRQTRFKLFVSTDNTNWTTVIDYSANTTVQPEVDGFTFTVPSA